MEQREAVMESAKQQFLDAYEREYATTMRVLRAYPEDKVELRPHPKCRTARELAWIFVLESMLGRMGFANAFAQGVPGGSPPPPPESWREILTQIEKTHKEFGDLIRATPEDELRESIKFLIGPKTLGDYRRIDFLWFLLSDQIHHRGQFSIYLRMADGRVPSIYGPSGDEPWN